jgi:hypothetical protein
VLVLLALFASVRRSLTRQVRSISANALLRVIVETRNFTPSLTVKFDVFVAADPTCFHSPFAS